eukprot:366413-Chlamydomonas_euryale.AAC.22
MDVEQIIGMQSLYQGFEDANEHGDDMDSGGGGRSSSGSGSSDDDDDEDDDAAGFVSAPEHSSEIDAEAVSGIDIGLLNMGPNGAVPEGMLLGPSTWRAVGGEVENGKRGCGAVGRGRPSRPA